MSRRKCIDCKRFGFVIDSKTGKRSSLCFKQQFYFGYHNPKQIYPQDLLCFERCKQKGESEP
mgnify:CR=1 FL=1